MEIIGGPGAWTAATPLKAAVQRDVPPSSARLRQRHPLHPQPTDQAEVPARVRIAEFRPTAIIL
jgi:hypothetical protein